MTDVYIKGRYDMGRGKSAVICVKDGKVLYEKVKVWEDEMLSYKGYSGAVDAYNCEIIAAICGVMIADYYGDTEARILTNTKVQKWYQCFDYPENRELMRLFEGITLDMYITSEHIPKDDPNPYNVKVNEMALFK